MGWRCGGCCSGHAATPTLADLAYVHAAGGNFNIAGQQFQRMMLDVDLTDPLGLWDPVNAWYTVPTDGTYVFVGVWRPTDGTGVNCNFGVGVDTAERDSPTFRWSIMGNNVGSPSKRGSFATELILHCNAGDQMRLFGYADTPGTILVADADLQIYRLASD